MDLHGRIMRDLGELWKWELSSGAIKEHGQIGDHWSEMKQRTTSLKG